MIASRRLLAVLAAVLLAAGCTAEVTGTAQPVPSPTAPSRSVAPEDIQFRLVVTDGTGGIMLTDGEGRPYELGDTLMDGHSVRSAQAQIQPETGQWLVMLQLTIEGAARFAQLTTDNVSGQIAIVVHGEVISAPVIQSPITDGAVQITGTFSAEEAKELASAITGQ